MANHMRHVPTILLLVLALTTTVHAECAWVLWEQRHGGNNNPLWQAKSGFATLDDCRKVIEETITQIKANPTQEVSQARESGEVTLFLEFPPKEGAIPIHIYRFRCLPDTAKPQL
jgi:hypothetical protein